MDGNKTPYQQLRETIEYWADKWIAEAGRYERLLYFSRVAAVAGSVLSLIIGFVTENPKVVGMIGAIPAATTLVVTELRWRDLLSWNWEAATDAWAIFNTPAFDITSENEEERTSAAQHAWTLLLQR